MVAPSFPKCAACVVAGLVGFGLAGCEPKPAANPVPYCFETSEATISATTKALFAKRQCQGGGVTWGPMLHTLLSQKGPVVSYTGDATGMLGGRYLFSGWIKVAIDDESSTALFCSSEAQLTQEMKADYLGLNSNIEQLTAVMNKTNALPMECLEADGSVPDFPIPRPFDSASYAPTPRQ